MHAPRGRSTMGGASRWSRDRLPASPPRGPHPERRRRLAAPSAPPSAALVVLPAPAAEGGRQHRGRQAPRRPPATRSGTSRRTP